MKRVIASVLVALVALQAQYASAFGPLTPGNLVVSRVGSGAASLSNAAAPTFLDEFNTFSLGQVPIQTIPLPTSASGANRQFTNSGTATSEGFLALSTNGQYLTLGGYDAAVGTAAVGTTTSATNPRVVARVDSLGQIDTSTALTDAYSAVAFRSVVSDNGTNFWLGGGGGSVRYALYGASTSTQLSTTITNIRVVNIYGSQLYCSSATGTFQGVSAVGTGLPTTSGQTITALPGMPTATGGSRYDFYFADPNTLYIADDSNITTASGGLQKWTFDGSIWSLAYTMTTNLTAGLRGLTGVVNGGVATLYATTADAVNATNGNKLVMVTDTGVGSPFTTLATAPGNEAFRGVEFSPVPEPASLVLLASGAVLFFRRRR